jgi:hypothetical protein
MVAQTDHLAERWVKCRLLVSRLRGLVSKASERDQEWEGRVV